MTLPLISDELCGIDDSLKCIFKSKICIENIFSYFWYKNTKYSYNIGNIRTIYENIVFLYRKYKKNISSVKQNPFSAEVFWIYCSTSANANLFIRKKFVIYAMTEVHVNVLLWSQTILQNCIAWNRQIDICFMSAAVGFIFIALPMSLITFKLDCTLISQINKMSQWRNHRQFTYRLL